MRPTKIRIRKTPCGLHLYTASIKGEPRYGWGDTPKEARECLLRQIEKKCVNQRAIE